MKTFKRSIAIIFAVIMALGIVAVGVYAATVSTTNTDYGYMIATDSKFTKNVSTVKLYGTYDYINFYIDAEYDDTYFFYTIVSSKDDTAEPLAADFIYCEERGTYTWSPMIKLKGIFKSGTYYCITYAAKMDSKGNAKISAPSMTEIKIVVDRTTAFNKQVVLLKNVKTTVNGPQITWYKHSSAATKYIIYRRSVNGTKWTKVGTVGASTLSFTDKSVKNKSGKYVYTVKALNKKGTASRYQFSGLTCLFAEAPVVKSVTIQADNKIQVKWNAASNATYYRVYRKTNCGSWEVIQKAYRGGTTYTDTTAVSGNNYQYTVRTYINTSHGTAISAYNAGKGIDYVASPELTGVNVVDNGMELRWNEAKGATAYTVYRRPLDLSSGWVNMGKVDANTFSFVDETATVDGAYRYTVRAEGKTSRGSYFTKGIDYLVLEAPAVKAYFYNDSYGYRNLKLNWNKVPYANAYDIYRKNAEGEWEFMRRATYGVTNEYFATDIGASEWSVQAVYTSGTTTIKSDIDASAVEYVYYPQLIAECQIFNDGITVSWGAKSKAQCYNVYRRVAGEAAYTLLAGELTETEYMDETAETGVCYEYCVKAVYGGVEQTTNYEGVIACRANNSGERQVTAYGSFEKYNDRDYCFGFIIFNGVKDEDRVYLKNENSGKWELLDDNKDYWIVHVVEGKKYTFAVSYYIDGAYTPIDDCVLEYCLEALEKLVITHKNTESKYKVSWNAMENAVKYEVLVGEVVYETVATIYSDDSENYSYSFSNAYMDKMGYNDDIVLRVYFENGDIVTYDVGKSYIRTPKMVSAERTADSQVKVTWEYTGSRPDKFYVYRKQGSGDWVRIGYVSPSALATDTYTYIDKTAKKGVAYTYTVKAAYDSGLTSGYQAAGVTCKAK